MLLIPDLIAELIPGEPEAVQDWPPQSLLLTDEKHLLWGSEELCFVCQNFERSETIHPSEPPPSLASSDRNKNR